MRRCASLALLFAFPLVVEATAFADVGDKGKGKPGGGSSSSGASSGGDSGSSSGSTDYTLQGDRALADRNGLKPVWAPWFELGFTAEFDGIFNHWDTTSTDSWYQMGYLVNAVITPSPYDRILVRWGFTQHFITNADKPATRLDDLTVAYTRTIPLPGKIDLGIRPRVDFGTGYDARVYGGYIASPRLGISLERNFGPLKLFALGYGQYWFQKYTTYGDVTGMDAGQATPKGRVAASLEASVVMPFHKPLTIGVAGYFAATWKNMPADNGMGTTLSGYPSGTAPTSSDPLTPNQPLSNDYGGEIFARYAFPNAGPVAIDLTAGVFNGNPTLGYQGLLHDGVARFNFYYTHTAGGYAALNIRY